MKRVVQIGIPVVILAVMIGWRLNLKKHEAQAQTDQRAARTRIVPAVTFAVAAVRDVQNTVDTTGTVEAPYNIKITSKTTGLIQYLQVREGDPVRAGETLVRIDPSQAQAMVSQKQAAVAEAESRLAQAQLTQNPVNMAVSTQILQQNAGVSSAVADYEQQSQNSTLRRSTDAAAISDARHKAEAAQTAISNAQAGLGAAQANLNNAITKLNRVTDLYKQGFIAAQDVDDARTAVEVQRGAVAVASGQIEAARAQYNSAQAVVNSVQEQAVINRTKDASDTRAARNRLRQAQASLSLARSNTSQAPAYQANLAALRSAVEAARADLRNTQSQLGDTVLRSPISGFVTGRYLDQGALATPGAPIVAVQAIRQVWVTASVTEEESRGVYAGLTTQVTLDALPGRTLTGKIVQANPSADPVSRQFTIRVLLENPRNQVKPGMFAHLHIVTSHQPGSIVVPREAIQRGKQGPFVDIVSAANTVHVSPVVVGPATAVGVTVKSGVQSGDRVVTLSAMPLKEGSKVRPMPATA